MSMVFAGVLGIASVIVLFQWREHARVDNVIEAAIGTAILATVAGIFVLTEMKAFRMVLPRRKQKVMKVEPTEKEPNTNADVNKESAVDSSRSESADISRDEKTVNGPFYKRSLWLKYALYLFGLSLFFNFLPNEPVMGGGTREVTIMVYFFSILATTFLFCWVFLGTLSKNRGLHVLSAIFVFLTGKKSRTINRASYIISTLNITLYFLMLGRVIIVRYRGIDNCHNFHSRAYKTYFVGEGAQKKPKLAYRFSKWKKNDPS